MYYFIVNPKSKSKHGKELGTVVAEQLRKRNVPHKIFYTKYRGHGTKLAHDITQKDPDCTLVAVGGDGTIHEVLTGITNYDTITFGYIPSGSGNDFARGMKIDKNTLSALECILNPCAYMNMDLGVVARKKGTQRFGVSCGIGFDASVTHEAMASPLKSILNRIHLGKLTYALLAIKQLFFYDPCEATMTLDDNQTFHYSKMYFAAVFNQNVEGGGLKLAPKARPGDQILDVIVVSDIPRIKILLVLPLAFWGLHEHIKGVHLVKCRRVKISCSRKLPVHLDGESGGIHNSLFASLEPKKLRVIVG